MRDFYAMPPKNRARDFMTSTTVYEIENRNPVVKSVENIDQLPAYSLKHNTKADVKGSKWLEGSYF